MFFFCRELCRELCRFYGIGLSVPFVSSVLSDEVPGRIVRRNVRWNGRRNGSRGWLSRRGSRDGSRGWLSRMALSEGIPRASSPQALMYESHPRELWQKLKCFVHMFKALLLSFFVKPSKINFVFFCFSKCRTFCPEKRPCGKTWLTSVV